MIPSETRPLVSCIVPVFNGEKYLAESLDSIFAQTYRPIEVIVADDGSTDGSRGLVESYAEPVRWISQKSAGPPAARNLGARAARGEMLAFLDADDLWLPEKLAMQVSRLQSRPELDACVAHVRMFWAPELREEEEFYREHPRAQAIPGYASISLLAQRTVFDRIGMYREDLWSADSTEWFIRFREAGLALDCMEEVLVLHRMHSNNLTRRRSEASKAEFARVVADSLLKRRGRP